MALGPGLDAEPTVLLTLWRVADAAGEESFVPAPLAGGRHGSTQRVG